MPLPKAMGAKAGGKPAGAAAGAAAGASASAGVGSSGSVGGANSSSYTKALNKHGYSLVKKSTTTSTRFSVMVTGDKGAAKTCNLATVPRIYGGRSIFITFDDVTLDALVTLYGEEWLEENRVEVYELTKAQYDYVECAEDDPGALQVVDGAVRRANGAVSLVVDKPDGWYKAVESYPGFDINRTWTAEVVIGQLFGLLEQFEADGDVDNIFLDHFQALDGDVGKALVYLKANAEYGARIDWQHWDNRAAMVQRAWKKARAVARHFVALTGYGDEPVWEDEDYLNAQGETKTKKVKKWVDPKWVERVKRDVLYTIHVEQVEEEVDKETRIRYVATPKNSKNQKLFPVGERVDVTRGDGKEGGFGEFWRLAEEHSRAADELPTPSA